jgi:glycosyltransferase involved in cell wall biosynthesis
MSEGGLGEAEAGSGETEAGLEKAHNGLGKASALPLSVAIVTLNEEANLPRLLESVRGLAAEIVIVDSGSTDRTEAIAKEAGAVFATAPWEGFVVQKNRSLDRCTQPWVLFLDADEALSPELAASVRRLFANGPAPDAEGFWLNRRTWYLGAWIWHAWYPEWRLRLARRGAGRWGGMDPHAKLEVGGATKRLEGDLLHYSFRDLQDHLERTIRYSRTMANSYIKTGKRFRWSYLLLSPWVAFFKHLVLKQGWRDGWRGWLISVIRAIDVFAKYAFLLEKDLKAGGGPKEKT